MRCSLVSGGDQAITGVMVIDDLSVARSPVPNLLFGKLLGESLLLTRTNLDQVTGVL